ncbi:MAG: hypothetical protein JMN25_18365, partial [gamma proteobacterium endosymbiont of Lamellibrachia anaximandri]|nr:hypothetical protein [gamma proteobacterium endosymbiont of Lamellibrachia anaximandri]
GGFVTSIFSERGQDALPSNPRQISSIAMNPLYFYPQIFLKSQIFSTSPWLNKKSVATNGKDIGPILIETLQEQNIQLESLHSAIVGEEESSIAGQIKLFRSDVNDRGNEVKKLLSMNVKLTKKITDSADAQKESVDALKQAVSGEEESSIAGQIKLFRSDAGDRTNEIKKLLSAGAESMDSLHNLSEDQKKSFEQFSTDLWKRLEEFAEMLSKSATEQVINALKDVIADFNKQLTEQFGENFKALDASVQKLVEWQENYKEQLGQMSEQYQQGVTAITQTESSVAHISEESKAIPVAMGELRQVIEVNQHQVDELDRHLKAFSAVRDKAVEAVPEIHKQIETMTTSVADSTRTLSEGLVTSSEAMLSAISGGTEAFDGAVKDQLGAMADALDKNTQKLADEVVSSGEKMQSEITKGAKAFGDSVEEQLEAMNEAVGQSTHKLSDGIVESTKSVSSSIAIGVEEFDNNVQRLSGNLTSTSDILSQQTVTIREQLQDTVSDLNNNTRNMVETLVDGAKTLTEDTLAMNQAMKQTGQQIEHDAAEIQLQVASSIEQMQRRLESTLEEVFQVQTREMNRALDGVSSAVKSAVDRTGEGVNAQIQMIDESMKSEIDRVMNEMGTALGMITNQFTKDYTKLVQAMSTIVQQGSSET